MAFFKTEPNYTNFFGAGLKIGDAEDDEPAPTRSKVFVRRCPKPDPSMAAKLRDQKKRPKMCSPSKSSKPGGRFSVAVGVEKRRRPPAPFILYYLIVLKDEQRKAGKGNPRPRILLVIKRASKCWKNLSSAEKGVYRKRYCQEIARIKRRRAAGGAGKGNGC